MKCSFPLLLLISFLLSCTKEESSTATQANIDRIPQFAMTAAKFQNTALFLKREVSYLRHNPLLKQVRLFTYDNANRVVTIRLGAIDSAATNPEFTLRQTLTFSYNDAASLLPASVSSVRSVFPNLVTTYYYQYNSEGRKIKDSVRVKNQDGQPADRIIHYVYKEDEVYTTPVFRGFPLENNSMDTLSLLKNGNIEKFASRMIRSGGDLLITSTFTYDQGISPYNKLNIANSLYFESASLGIGYNVPKETHYMGVTTNNMTSMTTGNHTVTFKYVYNQQQYPTRKELYLPGSTTPDQVTLFEY